MDNRDGFDIQKLDREVDELLSDVKDLLNENADSVNESGGEDAADADAAAPELPQEQAPEMPAFPPEAMSDATVVYKPLTYYEQSKPAYQTARRAQYEREREHARLERERQRLAREAEEEKIMQELEQRQKSRAAARVPSRLRTRGTTRIGSTSRATASRPLCSVRRLRSASAAASRRNRKRNAIRCARC